MNIHRPSNDRIPVLKNNSSIEKYSPALSEGNIGLNNLIAIGDLKPAEWRKINIVEGLRNEKYFHKKSSYNDDFLWTLYFNLINK